MKLGST